MKNAKDIIYYLETQRREAYKNHAEWKDISPSEAQKYIIKATTIEGILDDIAPFEERLTKEEPAQTVPQMPKSKLLKIYLNIFSFVVLISSCVAVWSFVSGLLDKWGVTGLTYNLLLYGYEIIHIVSFTLMLAYSHLLLTTKK